jgi:hypothetical protein
LVTVRQGGLVAVVLGVVLLPVGVGAAISDHTSAKAALERALDNLAQTQAQLLSDHFARARSVNLLMSNNPSLSDIFELPGDRKARITGGSRTVDRANEALAYLETLFPRSIGEVCLIDRSGAEEARVVRGERAQFDELSLAENEAPFFSPTFALDQGSVYQAAPYGSPDTDEWVVSNSTKLPAAATRRRPSCTSRSPSRASARRRRPAATSRSLSSTRRQAPSSSTVATRRRRATSAPATR